MSKCVLVMDMPSGCIKCPFYDYVPSLCFLTNKFQNNISDDFKPDWCPLCELPEKMQVCSKYPQEDRIVPSYKIGQNACIDELLKNE